MNKSKQTLMLLTAVSLSTVSSHSFAIEGLVPMQPLFRNIFSVVLRKQIARPLALALIMNKAVFLWVLGLLMFKTV